MKQIKTSLGFEAEIDEKRLDDMELLDAIVAMDQGRKEALSTVVDKVLGPDKARLYALVREKEGRVPIKKVTDQVREIFDQLKAKNS